jgi:hypothetical protein
LSTYSTQNRSYLFHVEGARDTTALKGGIITFVVCPANCKAKLVVRVGGVNAETRGSSTFTDQLQTPWRCDVLSAVVRAYSVATVKSAGSLFAAYYLRKHHSKLWAFPLIANSAIGLQGVTQNMIECN